MYFVYILTNKTNKVFYTGVTNNLERRLYEHKNHLVDGFSCKYNTTKLIYYEVSESVESAIAREKQIKAYRRDKKIALINELNSERKDLSLEWQVINVMLDCGVPTGDSSLNPNGFSVGMTGLENDDLLNLSSLMEFSIS